MAFKKNELVDVINVLDPKMVIRAEVVDPNPYPGYVTVRKTEGKFNKGTTFSVAEVCLQRSKK